MNPRTVLSLACKILSLYGVLILLSHLGSAGMMLIPTSPPDTPSPFPFWITLVPYLMLIAYVILLWTSADIIGRTFDLPQQEGENKGMWDGAALYHVALTILGLYVLLETLPTLTYSLVQLWYSAHYEFGMRHGDMGLLSLITPFAQSLLAFLLILRAKGVANLIMLLQKAPIRNKAAEVQSDEQKSSPQ